MTCSDIVRQLQSFTTPRSRAVSTIPIDDESSGMWDVPDVDLIDLVLVSRPQHLSRGGVET